MLKINKELHSLNNILKDFPNRWITVENQELDELGEIKGGRLLAVCQDDEIDDYLVYCGRQALRISHSRTTEIATISVQSEISTTKPYFLDDRLIIPDYIKNMSKEELHIAIEKLEKEIRQERECGNGSVS